MLLQGSDTAISEKTSHSLTLTAAGIKMLEVGTNGIISQYPGVTLDLDSQTEGNYLGIKVNFNTDTIGYLAIRLNSNSVGVYPTSAFP